MFLESDTSYGEVRLGQNPTAAAAGAAIGKGQLVMVATIRKAKIIKEGEKPSANMLSLGTANLLIASDTSWNEPAFVSPFWLVETTTDESKGNMELVWHEAETHLEKDLWPIKIPLPLLKNTKKLGIADRLYRNGDAPTEPPVKKKQRTDQF